MFKDWAGEAGLPAKAMYSVREVASVVGIPASTIYDEVAGLKLKAFRTGRVIRIRPEWVDDWIEKGTR